jgi:hypothetical protein
MDADIDDLDGLRIRYTLQAFTRRAVADKLHYAWVDTNMSEQADRVERLETIMSSTDFALAGQHLLEPIDRATVMNKLDQVPANLRADLDAQQYRLKSDVYRHLGAEHRRRVCEVRCWIIDAIEAIDMLDFHEARRLVVDAEHQLGYLMTSRPQNHRPSQTRFEFDRQLRERTLRIVMALRTAVVQLRPLANGAP